MNDEMGEKNEVAEYEVKKSLVKQKRLTFLRGVFCYFKKSMIILTIQFLNRFFYLLLFLRHLL